MPFAALPMLEWDDHTFVESNTIARFVARKIAPDLLGTTDEEKAWADMASDYTQDFYVDWVALSLKWEAGDKEKYEQELVEKLLPQFFTNIEKVFLRDGKIFVAGDKVRSKVSFTIKNESEFNHILAYLGRSKSFCGPGIRMHSNFSLF